jgi:hypothetical protein
VRVTVRPTALVDAATTTAGAPVSIPVLSNDVGTGLSITSVGSRALKRMTKATSGC